MKVKKITLILALFMVLVCCLGAVSAAEDAGSDVAASDDAGLDEVIGETDSDDDSVSTNEQADEVDDSALSAEENAEGSGQDVLKAGTRTVDVNDFTGLQNAINSAVQDSENDTYIINLNSGTYELTASTTLNDGLYHPNIIINGNDKTLSAKKTSYKLTLNNCNITINNLIFTTQLITGSSDLTLNQVNLGKTVTNKGNLKITNSTIDATIKNEVSLTVDDDTVFGASALISGNGEIITTNPNIAACLSVYDGNYVVNGATISNSRTNKGNLTLINSIITQKSLPTTITNEGNLTIINCTLVSCTIQNSGHLIIDENTTFGSSFKLAEGYGSTGSYGDIDEIMPYITSFAGDYTFENTTVNLQGKSNYGVLHFINCTLTSSGNFVNDGDIYIINSTSVAPIQHNKGTINVINSTLSRSISMGSDATLIIDDDSNISGIINNDKGTVISTNPQLIYNLSYLVGDYTICNYTFSSKRTLEGNIILINCTFAATQLNAEIINNKGNLTIFNSTISTFCSITNNANLTLKNMTMANSNAGIFNYGYLTIDKSILAKLNNDNGIIEMQVDEDKTVEEVYGPNLIINNNNNGIVQTNDLTKLFPYINGFYQELTIELGDYDKNIKNYGNLTILNSNLTGNDMRNYGNLTILNSRVDKFNNGDASNHVGNLILINTTINSSSNLALMELRNVTVEKTIYNTQPYSTLIISDDTKFGENFVFNAGQGTVITNNTDLFFDYVNEYYGNVVLTNKTIDTPKLNYATLTLNNCTINSVIENYGSIIIDDETVFGENAQITGPGDVVVKDISRALPYISIIKGNHIISDKTLTKTYTFYGTITLNNCTITSLDNVNYGTLILNNCTVDVGEDNTFLTNLQTVHISKDTTINGKINDLSNGVEYENEPQNIPKTYIITQDSIKYFIDSSGLNSVINPGDTLDIRGKIILNNSLRINKPVNIISSTNDGWIDLNTTAGDYFGSSQGNSFAIYSDGAYTNITGVTFHNTQLWIYGTHHVTFDKVSVVVENQRIGSGVGIFSIREGSSYITVKNSYLHTTDNERSSTLVLALADYCTIENNTIEGDGAVGNLLYITTYNVASVPTGMYNTHNKIINNRIRGPEQPTATCYGICISGFDNLVENNTINYSGYGIMFQWGSGITGTETAGNESLVGSGENIVRNNKLYGGCGINAGDLIYDNYMEGNLAVPENSKAYNNTAMSLNVYSNSEITDNTILGKVTFGDGAKDSVLSNNNIKGDITIPATVTNMVLSNNNITGSVTLDGSFNNLTNNRIITTNNYAVSSNKLGQNNNLTGNYLVANGKVGNDAVSLRDPSNVIASAGVATKVEVSVPGEVTVNKTVQVTVKLTDANGNPIDGQVTVSSALGSETVNVTKGTGVYQYTPKAIGEDTISVKFAGNDTFYLSSNSSNVNVIAEKAPAQQNETKTPTKTPAKTVVSLSFVKAPKKVSKKAKKLIISAKLKVNGKLVAGKKLTFKFKGKTFKVKTNKKGVAKLTIKSKVLKKLLKKVKAGKKVKYQVSYGKKTVKKTLKVKK